MSQHNPSNKAYQGLSKSFIMAELKYRSKPSSLLFPGKMNRLPHQYIRFQQHQPSSLFHSNRTALNRKQQQYFLPTDQILTNMA
mmetsp:Transcript_32123/g.96262  ORF Transcript_32123/g.96262 Transcript_32123/m.96262 type:complete len:84 (+) Transcript_32123:397-648(+)